MLDEFVTAIAGLFGVVAGGLKGRAGPSSSAAEIGVHTGKRVEGTGAPFVDHVVGVGKAIVAVQFVHLLLRVNGGPVVRQS